jgi:hypothetical protein
MPPKNIGCGVRLQALSVGIFLRWCALSLALICCMDELHASQRRANSRIEERSANSTWEERSAPLADAQRVFDSTVRPRLTALLALDANELGRRECGGASAREPLRGRLERAVVLAANEQLSLPMGAASILTVAGRQYLFCLEPHYHPPGAGIGPEGWHKGVTVYQAHAANERRL